MLIILTIHSIVRWAIVLVAIALIVRLVLGLRRKQPFDKSARMLTTAFTGLMDTQMLLGILYLVWDGLGGGTGFPRIRMEHGVAMVLAVIVAHLPAAWKKASDHVRTRNTLIAVIVALVIIFIGVARLGMPRWWNITY